MCLGSNKIKVNLPFKQLLMLYNSLVICILTIQPAVCKTYNGCLGNRSAYSWPGSRINKFFLRRGVRKVSFVFEHCKGENGFF